MAGGKETPRQKLIGLMYLVLLALLALQVSSAIIQKFQFLNNSLELALKEYNKGNDKIIEKIKKAAEESKRDKDLQKLEQARKVSSQCRAVIADIDALKARIIKETEGVDEKGNYNGAKDEDKVAGIMAGLNRNGEGYKLKTKLDNFVDAMNKDFPQFTFQRLAQDAKDDPLAKGDADQKGKDFVQLNFEHTPMVAVMAVLSDKQNKIANMESQVLSSIEIGEDVIKTDKMFAMVNAKSSVVAAGTDFEADLFLSAGFSSITPTMKFRGSPIKVENGIGKVKFKAAAGAYDKDGNSKQNYEASISFQFKGKDTTFVVKGEYIVAKPVLDVKSASVSALYYNCGNDLNIQCPALGANYKPSFRATGADVITGAEKGSIILIPTSKDKVSVAVSSDGSAIGSKDFPVRMVPKPTIAAKINGAYVNQKSGVPAPGPQNVAVLAEPDQSFAAALPKEARYQVAAGEVTLARGKRELGTVQFSNNNANLGSLRNQAQSGDRYIIVVKKVLRANFQNKTEDVQISSNSSVITIPIQ